MAQFTFVQTCQISEIQLGSSEIKELLSFEPDYLCWVYAKNGSMVQSNKSINITHHINSLTRKTK